MGASVATSRIDPEQYREANSCLRKVAYDKKHFAQNVAADVFLRDGTVLAVYECTYCGKWHLGKDKK